MTFVYRNTCFTYAFRGGRSMMKMDKRTGELTDELIKTKQISDYLSDNADEMLNTDLGGYLTALMEKAGLNRSSLAVKAGLNRFYIYDIFSGRKNPSADKLICIALALQADLEETQILLRLADRAGLYVRHPRDSVLIFAIQRHLSVDETNALLYEAGQRLLTE